MGFVAWRQSLHHKYTSMANIFSKNEHVVQLNVTNTFGDIYKNCRLTQKFYK